MGASAKITNEVIKVENGVYTYKSRSEITSVLGISSVDDFIYYTTVNKSGHVVKHVIEDSETGEVFDIKIAESGDNNYWEEISIDEELIQNFINENSISEKVVYDGKEVKCKFKAFRSGKEGEYIYNLYLINDNYKFSVIKSYTFNSYEDGTTYISANLDLMEEGKK